MLKLITHKYPLTLRDLKAGQIAELKSGSVVISCNGNHFRGNCSSELYAFDVDGTAYIDPSWSCRLLPNGTTLTVIDNE